MAPLDAEEIQQAMRRVRCNLGNDVENLVQQARDATDWRCYVRRHPWACMGAMAVAGYFCVPRGKPTVTPFASSGATCLRDVGCPTRLPSIAAIRQPGGIASTPWPPLSFGRRQATPRSARIDFVEALEEIRRGGELEIWRRPARRYFSDSGGSSRKMPNEAEPW